MLKAKTLWEKRLKQKIKIKFQIATMQHFKSYGR
jgi:hypothetical protein